MSIEEAFKLSQEQKLPITHRFFGNGEYIRVQGNCITLEDGVVIFKQEFMSYRKDKTWETDWEIYN